MADPNIVTQEEMALRRRARRRLVGAVAIALSAIVVLPMVFDPDPKPLGPDVDLRIPAKDTPFDPIPSAPPAAVAPVEPPSMAMPAVDTRSAEPTQVAVPAESKPAASKPLPEAKREKREPEPEKKAEEPVKTTTKPVAKPETKVAAKADAAFASRGFFLQLGAFTNEANATQLRDKAEAAGFKVNLNGANGQYRVRVGPIVEHDKAMEMQSKLKAKGFAPVMLGP